MIRRIDLTHTEEEFGDLLTGARVTSYDGRTVFILSYDVDMGTDPYTQTHTTTELLAENVVKLRDWLNELLEDSK